jgi:hypothetical protein
MLLILSHNQLKDETELVRQLHYQLTDHSRLRYWHVLICRTAAIPPGEGLEGQLGFGQATRRWYAFRVQGQDDSVLKKVARKTNELVVFMGLAVLLFMTLACKSGQT